MLPLAGCGLLSLCLVAPSLALNVVEARLPDGQVLAPELAWAATALLGLGWLLPLLLTWWLVRAVWPGLPSRRSRIAWLAVSLVALFALMSISSGWVATVGDPFREHLLAKRRSPDRERIAYLFEEPVACGFAVYERPMDRLLADRVLRREASCEAQPPALVYEGDRPALSCEALDGLHRDYCVYGELVALRRGAVDEAVALAATIEEPVIRGAAIQAWTRGHAGALPERASAICALLPGAQRAHCRRELQAAHLRR